MHVPVHAMPDWLWGCWDLNSGPLACEAIIFMTAQPPLWPWISKLQLVSVLQLATATDIRLDFPFVFGFISLFILLEIDLFYIADWPLSPPASAIPRSGTTGTHHTLSFLFCFCVLKLCSISWSGTWHVDQAHLQLVTISPLLKSKDYRHERYPSSALFCFVF